MTHWCHVIYVGSFFPRTVRLWNFLPIECFPFTYDLNDSSFNSRSFLNRFLVSFSLFVLLFLVTPYLVVAVWPCMEWIPIEKRKFRSYQLQAKGTVKRTLSNLFFQYLCDKKHFSTLNKSIKQIKQV